ncbi:MAG: HAMP domain-containing protein [Anaerolineales bacterium]|nr:HAMP domain-containing protein [Anaerolineales bacterium]
MKNIRQLLVYIPLRLRLALWFTGALGAILLLMGAFVYWQTQRTMLSQIDHALELAAVQATLNMQDQGGQLAFQNLDENRVELQHLDDDFVVYLLSADGAVWDKLGNNKDEPVYTVLPTGYTSRQEHGEGWRILSQEVTIDSITGWLQVRQDMERLENALRDLRRQMALGLPLALVLAGLGGFWLASQALQPIDQMTRTAQTITADDLSRRIGYEGPADEIGRLAQTFDGMLGRLQTSFERERRFTGDAAHELRTPLTVLKGSIGVTLSKPRETGACMETLAVMEEEVDRLIRLSNDLLFMARLDQRQYRVAWDWVELESFLGAVVDQIRPLAAAKSIQLQETIPAGLKVRGDMDLLIRLFLNLLDNAIKYTPLGGEVRITTTQAGSRVNIAICDSGPGIAPDHLPQLFDRFYRAEADRGRGAGKNGQGGAGLGLAIAQEIARAHGGQITVESELGVGTRFVVCL